MEESVSTLPIPDAKHAHATLSLDCGCQDGGGAGVILIVIWFVIIPFHQRTASQGQMVVGGFLLDLVFIV